MISVGIVRSSFTCGVRDLAENDNNFTVIVRVSAVQFGEGATGVVSGWDVVAAAALCAGIYNLIAIVGVR